MRDDNTEEDEFGGFLADDDPLEDPRSSGAYRFFKLMVVLLVVLGFLISVFNQ